MSHFSRLKTRFVEKEYLLKALTDLGYTYEEGELTIEGFNGRQTPVDIRISIPVSYDIGLRKKGDHYEIVADWFGVRGIKPKDFENSLAQRYAYHAARDQMERQGFNLVEETQDNGQIRLVLRRAA
ncbi:MAG TPA: DUF1257 domain-containing protein [Chloroflexi bacterium]|nr:DUF1257 domain-containing protein [Chloroflexota bacterium]